jgi:hypothetical protein
MFDPSGEELENLRHLAASSRLNEAALKHDLPYPDDIHRLVDERLVRLVTNCEIDITEDGAQLLHVRENPPPRNRWMEFQTWFLDQWWSVPLILLGIIPPALIQWVEIIWALCRWATAR